MRNLVMDVKQPAMGKENHSKIKNNILKITKTY